ncbi:hypothetical protein PUV54_03060 [Hyphococcus flavus]|uniref:Uncharacterized protein n=1 Tax=Hyphococcus flavus TaxID=1866326 RepID=A0AAF0CBZ0_9PROT|nr:hypothetical protein [Hyphococcus flavus]WDI32170.1 hypothetical protein PUV54_03060 [Hyphococcus flavus]
MKWLYGLCAFQTLLLGGVSLQVAGFDVRTDEIADMAREAKHAAAQSANTASDDWSWPSSSTGGASAEEIRLIVQEEIAALETNIRASASAQYAAQTTRAVKPRLEQKEIERLEASYQNDLSYYRSRGAITDKEMASLQMTIAKLPQTERRAALSQLARALASGEIDGRM